VSNRKRTQNQNVFKFKSSGELLSSTEKYKRDTSFEKLIGIKTPLSFGSGRDGIFAMHKSLKDQIKDNFINMLKTNRGQRLGNYSFGANLEGLAFELATDEIESDAINRINATISKFMPYITLNNFEAFTEHFDNSHVARVGIRVTYSIPNLGVANEQVEVILKVTG